MKTKGLLLLLVVLVGFYSCGNQKKEKTGAEEETPLAEASASIPEFKLDDLLLVADQHLDQKVVVRGFVTHTCAHSGKRCFIVGENQNTSFRVEAGDEISGFDRELVGSELLVTGVLKERRMTKEYIDQHEKEVNEKKAEEDGSAESCQAELDNIQEMREWMKANGKDYYSIYFMEGESYEVVTEG